MKIDLISTMGGGVGKNTSNLVKGLRQFNDLSINLHLIDNRREFLPPMDDRVSYGYLSTISHPLLAKAKSTIDLFRRRLEGEVVHFNYASNSAFIRRHGGKAILTMHGFPRPEIEIRLSDKLAYFLEQSSIALLPEKTKVVTISKYSKEMIMKRYGINADVVYNGIDLTFYKPSAEKEKLKELLNLKGKRVILFVGRLHPMKDPITLVKSYINLRESMPDLYLYLVGTGPLEEEIISITEKSSVPIRICSGLSDEDLRTLYQCCDLFVFPSIGEPFGLALAEAMSCGCVCIASNSGASPELLGLKNVLIEPSNQKELAEVMKYFLDNEEARSNASYYLLQRARSSFSLHKMAMGYYEIYRSN